MRIGVDLGGTKIEAIALDDRGVCLGRERVATRAGDYPAILDAIAELVVGLERGTGQSASVGVGSPGALSQHTGLLKNSNSTVLNGKPLDRDIARRLGRPIRLENDANCFALSEAIDGAAKDAEVVFGVILGTGVGAGLVTGKRLLAGRNRVAGEWGHNPMPWPNGEEWPGPPCYCGKTGCIETLLSGPGWAAEFARRTGRTLSAVQIASAARAGDAQARAALARLEDRLARGLALVINLIDPDTIVLGGGLSNIESLYRNVPPLLARYVFSDAVLTRLAPAAYGDSSGVRGAAWLWPAEHIIASQAGRESAFEELGRARNRPALKP